MHCFLTPRQGALPNVQPTARAKQWLPLPPAAPPDGVRPDRSGDQRPTFRGTRPTTGPRHRNDPGLHSQVERSTSSSHRRYIQIANGRIRLVKFRPTILGSAHPRTDKMLQTEAGQSNGKFCPRSNWKHYLD